MTKPRLVLLGGFLGSGKTTLMMALGERLVADGRSVAIVTNDQGEFLVDTDYARSRGLTAGEVLNGCFCCNFGGLVSTIEELIEQQAPDYIIAEPVGSCTDLVATVLHPIDLYHRGLVEIGGHFTLADVPRMMGEYTTLDLSAPITPRETLISHQLREAGTILLTKTDLARPSEIEAAGAAMQSLNPSAEILTCSVRNGEGLEHLIEIIESASTVRLPDPVPLEYDVYAEAEAEMGWYNGRATLSVGKSGGALPTEDIALDLVEALRTEYGNDMIHGKILLSTADGSLKMSLVGNRVQADSTLPTGSAAADDGESGTLKAGITINLRAVRHPDALSEFAGRLLKETARRYGLELSDYRFSALIPSEPRPTHRVSLL